MASSFDAFIEAACRNGDVPGAIMAATNKSGSFRYEKAIEGRKFDEIPSTPAYELDSVLLVYSCTKIITTIAVLQCVERGLIGLDDDVSSVLPDLGSLEVLVEYEDGKAPVFEAKKSAITLRLLLTHSAGLASGRIEPLLIKYRAARGEAHLTDTAKTINEKYLMPLATQPGTVFSYNSGHDFAGKIVEKLTGTTLDQYVRAHVAAPLGINTFTFWPDQHPEIKAKLMQVSKRGIDGTAFKKIMVGGVDDDDAPLYPMPEFPGTEYTECFGGESLKASIPDFLKVLQSILANDEKLLKKVTVDQMFTPQMTPESHASLNAAFPTIYAVLAPGEYPPEGDKVFGMGALLVQQDYPGWRGKGTLMWSGLTNLLWFIDRKNDLCGVFGTQLLPSGDNRSKKVITAWEKEMHRLAAAAEEQ